MTIHTAQPRTLERCALRGEEGDGEHEEGSEWAGETHEHAEVGTTGFELFDLVSVVWEWT